MTNITVAANRKSYIDLASLAIVNRWNGDDAVNTDRTQLIPVNGDLKGDVSFFILPVEHKAKSHFSMDVVGGDGRNWMSGYSGTGEISEEGWQSERQYQKVAPRDTDTYTAAHEFGHGASMPDEYPENGSQYSYRFLPIRCNLPGDPFLNDKWGMMYFAYEMRNRYFWHHAEFARRITGKDFKVKYDAYPDYRLPRHPDFPQKSYAYWPVAESLGATWSKGKFDVLLYAAGPDKYTTNIAAKGPYQGILVLIVKMYVAFPSTFNEARIRRILGLMQGAITSYGPRFYAAGTKKVNTGGGTTENWQFTKCLVEFSPRVHVENNNLADQDYIDVKAAIPVHFDLTVQNSKKGASDFAGPAPKQLKLVDDFTDPNIETKLVAQFKNFFAQMIGGTTAADITAAHLTEIAKLVMPDGSVTKA